MKRDNRLKSLFLSLAAVSTLAMGANPDIITTLAFNGDPDHGGDTSSIPVIAKFAYTADDGDYSSGWTTIAKAKDVGSVWGLAYAPRAQKLYAATVVRRHNGLKGNPGDIYKIDLANGNAVSKLVTLSAGSVTSNSSRGLGDKDSPSHDPLFSEIAKVGLGDIDISADESTLYAMNLKDRKLYQIDTATGSVKKSIAVGDPFGGCSEVRPWATKVTSGGDVYVGSVCVSDYDKGAAISKLTGAGFTTVKTMPLTYDRQRSDGTDATAHTNWKQWEDDPSNVFHKGYDYPNYPQPILSDIEIADDGSFVLGFLDRFSLQAGHKNYAPDTSDSTLYNAIAAGDLKRICKVGNSYVLEGENGCDFHTADGDTSEYYTAEKYQITDDRYHWETALGGLAIHSGSGELLSSTYDPFPDTDYSHAYTGGVKTYNDSTGEHIRGKILYDSHNAAEGKARMGKAGGVGDVELLEEPPKTYCLGDYVWIDANQNGLQDSERRQ